MARIRTIKPEFFSDKSLASCSAHARLLAIALLQLCDKNGVFLHIPMQVHAHAFPWEATVKTQVLLGELEAIGYVKFFQFQGRDYGFVPGFAKHQRLTGKEAQSEGLHPTFDQANQSVADEKQQGNNGEAHGCFPEKHLDAQERERERERERSKSPERSQGSTQETPAITFTLNTGAEHPVTQQQLDEFASLYPGIDVMQELRKLKGWCSSNPTKRKTKRGASAFVNSWLSRAQDECTKHRGNGNGQRAEQPRRETATAAVIRRSVEGFGDDPRGPDHPSVIDADPWADRR